MVQIRFVVAAALLMSAACSARAQTVTWGGGFPNDKFNVASNWEGGTEPLNNGTETLQFTAISSSELNLNIDASFAGIVGLGTDGSQLNIRVSGSSHTLTLGSGGISLSGGNSNNTLALNPSVALAASQTWNIGNPGGTITVNGAISGNYGLTVTGGNGTDTYVFNSGTSTFTGGVTATGAPTVFLGATGQPVGTGTLTLGDGSVLGVPLGGAIVIGNPVTIGDATTGNSVTLGQLQLNNPAVATLKFGGNVSLVPYNSDQEIDVTPNTIVTFAGNLSATPGDCLDFGSATNGGNSVVVLQGSITNVSRLDLEDNASVIFDGAGPTQLSGISDIGQNAESNGNFSGTYLGLGGSYNTHIAAFLALNLFTPANFVGSIGLDTTSGSVVTFYDTIDLSGFTNFAFSGLGSATQAIVAGTIIPDGGSAAQYGALYRFGGGGGVLTVTSSLVDSTYSGNPHNTLQLYPGNAPLTLILSGTDTYHGSTHVDGGALIFNSPFSTPNVYLGQDSVVGGYVGATTNSQITASNPQALIGIIIPGSAGVAGFDTFGAPLTITGAIDLTANFGVFLGTATSVTYAGSITPGSNGFQFAGVKGGSVTVTSPSLTGANAVTIGLPTPIESFGTISSVTLSGTNTYTGGTTLNSGILYVTNSSSLGANTSLLTVPGNGLLGNAATLAIAPTYGSLTLAIPIAIQGNGLALNSGTTSTLTLMGPISDNGSPGSLGIFGPVDLEGANSYSGGTTISTSGATVTIGNDTGLGTGAVTADGSVLHFTSASPTLNGLQLSATTATFDGSPIINALSLSQSTVNFNGASAQINGMSSDASGSTDSIALGATQLTIDTNNVYDGNDSATYHGTISGAGGSLIVTGGGSLDLRGANTYGAGTTIEGDTLVIASNNSAIGSGTLTIDSGAIVTNTGVTLTNPIVLNGTAGNTAGLGGFGTYSPGGNLAFQNYSGLDPGRANSGGGNSSIAIPVPGTLTFGSGTSITFGSNGAYLFAITDATGAAGTGYGTVNLSGSLTITNTGNPFDIRIYSYDPATNESGNAINFNPANSYSWTLVSAGSISGFNASYFSVDASQFTNSYNPGTFYVSQSGNDLMLNFTPVPEPSTWAMMASGLLAMGVAAQRRRRLPLKALPQTAGLPRQ